MSVTSGNLIMNLLTKFLIIHIYVIQNDRIRMEWGHTA